MGSGQMGSAGTGGNQPNDGPKPCFPLVFLIRGGLDVRL